MTHEFAQNQVSEPRVGRPAQRGAFADQLILAFAGREGDASRITAMAGDIVSRLVTGETQRFSFAQYAPDRFGARASDTAWLRQQVSGIVSGGYRGDNK